MRELIVDNKFNNKKVSSFVLDNFKNLSFNEFQKALRKKDIKINGSRINKDTVVSLNDKVSIYISDNILLGNTFHLKTIFEDENILIVLKPINISVVSEKTQKVANVTTKLDEKLKSDEIKLTSQKTIAENKVQEVKNETKAKVQEVAKKVAVKKEEPKVETVPAAVPAAVADDTNGIVAAIIAAISSYRNASGEIGGFRVVSFKKRK